MREKFNFKIYRCGFTLIELLITISIIAILSAISLAMLSEINQSGRDAKRVSDLKSVQSALEQYYADQGVYPIPGSTNDCPATEDGALRWGCPLKSPNGSKTYLNIVPTGEYSFIPFNTNVTPSVRCDDDSVSDSYTKCTTYCLFSQVENESTQCNPENRDDLPASCTTGNHSSVLCISRLPEDYNFILTPP